MARNSKPSSLLIDTHVWLWLASGTELSTGVREALAIAASNGRLRVAAISVWEIAMLASRNRVTLGKPAAAWFEEALSAPGLSIEPLSPMIAIDSCHLPERFHADPADRLIVATTRVTGATLVTRDGPILNYASRGYLSTLAA